MSSRLLLFSDWVMAAVSFAEDVQEGEVSNVAGCTCSDNNPCTTDTCNQCVFGTCVGCLHAPVSNGTQCGDGNFCTLGDRCSNGACIGTPMNCDDGNECNIDGCSNGSCFHFQVPPNCNDFDVCTTDSCNPSTGCMNVPRNCDDGNACTLDACEPAPPPFISRCFHDPMEGTCSDGSDCTIDDRCIGGICEGEPMLGLDAWGQLTGCFGGVGDVETEPVCECFDDDGDGDLDLLDVAEFVVQFTVE